MELQKFVDCIVLDGYKYINLHTQANGRLMGD